MMKNISIRKFRSNLAHVLDDVKDHMDSYIISKRGEPTAVLMCIDDYEGWLETLSIMANKETMADIKKARQEIAQGRYYRFEDVFGKKRKKASKCSPLR